jgi:glycosyltransferase involved in cell wall biosynthesis
LFGFNILEAINQFGVMNHPFVSILIPCRNEEKYISVCLDSLLGNDYVKENSEIFIIDGMSKDNTLPIVESYINRFNFIKVYQNPGKIFPSAVNIGVRASKGDFIFIIGAHAQYDHEYISKCVDYSISLDADNIGGILITKSQNESYLGEIITFALSNRFGVGNATFRTGSEKIVEVDTVFGGCYRREVFNKIGFFNENLISTSDYEFNKRLRMNGGKIYIVPDIVTAYYTRTTFNGFISNNIRNGFWAIYPIALVNYLPVSFRHLVPLFFLLSLSGLFILSFFFKYFVFLLFGILILYFLLAFYSSIKALKIRKIVVLPFIFFLLHLTYGMGSFLALLKLVFLKPFELNTTKKGKVFNDN